MSKSYVDTYLRQPLTSEERKCIRGNEGECMLIDPSQKFVAVQYMLPWEKEKNSNGMCLLCVRAATRIFFCDIMVVHSGAVVNGIIQRL